MAFWADIDADYVLRYQQWHNCEHIPERVSIPGFRVGRRYRGVGNAPMFLMMYETDTPSVLASPAYLAAVDRPTDFTREALTHFRNPVRAVYGLIGERGERPPIEAPYLCCIRFNLAGDETAARDWHAETWLPAIARCDPVLRARLYEVDEQTSTIMTKERRIYGGGPGQQKYLALIEAKTLDPPGTDAWQAAERDLPQAQEHLAARTALYAESYFLEIALCAPYPAP
jgi:hypothetical protein